MTARRRHGRSTPLVGVTTYVAEASWGNWSRRAAVVPSSYYELVAAAGARPLLLPYCTSAPGGPAAGATEVVAALDGLVLVGGGDLDPAAYAQDRHPEAGGIDPERDASERALLEAALAADLPVLAICRGHQLLNVTLGGTLHQHLPDVVGHRGHQPAGGRFEDVDVVTVPGTRTAAIMGEKATVRCSHHQAVDRLGEGLVVAARAVEPAGASASGDGPDAAAGGAAPEVIEAIELPGRRFVVGVQWHPEEAGDRRLFDALVEAASS